jgi:hypothetical protein
MDPFLLKWNQKDFVGFWLIVALYHGSQITTDELTKIVSFIEVDDLKELIWRTNDPKDFNQS